MAALVATGLLGAERLRRQTQVLRGVPAESCRRLGALLQVTRQVGLGVCDRIASPVVLGVFRPMILLPPYVLSGCSPEQLEMILLHELAHVRRWDNLVNRLQRLVESVLFFHPAVWWVSQCIRRERENCCDAMVVARTGKPQGYASMLAALATPVRFHGALAFSESNLVGRIRRILELEHGGVAMPRAVLGSMALLWLVPTSVLLVYASMAVTPRSKAEERTRSEAERIFGQASQSDRPNAAFATLLRTLGDNRLKHWNAVSALAFTGDGESLVSAGCTIIVWDTASGQLRRTLAQRGTVVAFTADGRLAAVADRDHAVHIVEVGTGQSLQVLRGHNSPLRKLTFDRSGRMLAAGDKAGHIRLWNVADGTELANLVGNGRTIRSVALSPDGRMLASGTAGVLKLWDAPWKVVDAVDVAVDVKPGGEPNPVNLGSNGTLPVAVLSDAGFDAATIDTSDLSTILLGDPSVAARVSPQHAALDDVDGDGDSDLVLLFSVSEISTAGALVAGTTAAELTAWTVGGDVVIGTDSVVIVGGGNGSSSATLAAATASAATLNASSDEQVPEQTAGPPAAPLAPATDDVPAAQPPTAGARGAAMSDLVDRALEDWQDADLPDLLAVGLLG